MHRKRIWLVVAVAGSLAMAACSSSNGSSTTASSTSSTSSEATSSVAPVSSDATSSAAGPSSASSAMASNEPAASSPAGNSAPANPLPNTGTAIDVMGWTNGDEVGTARTAYVKQQDPSLKVQVDQNGFDKQKFATAMGSGSAPAGASMDRQLIATYAAKGFLEPLDDCISADAIDMSQYYPASVKEGSWDGHIYGIPEFYTIRAVMANDRVLKTAGLTTADIDTSNWDKISAAAKKMYKASGGKPTTIGFDPKLPEYLPLWTMANGGSIIDDQGKPTLNDPKVVEALKYTVGLVNAQGGWANFKSFRDTWDFFGAGNEFAKGKDQIGAMPYEQWYVNVLAGFGNSIDLSAAPFKDRQGNPLTFETGSSFVIPKGSPNAGGMCSFMKLATSQGAWTAAGAAREAVVMKNKSIFTGLFTANKTANAALQQKYVKPSSNAKIDAVVKVYYNALDSAKMIPPSPAGLEIETAYQQAATDALGGKDPQAALDAAQKTAMNAYTDATG